PSSRPGPARSKLPRWLSIASTGRIAPSWSSGSPAAKGNCWDSALHWRAYPLRAGACWAIGISRTESRHPSSAIFLSASRTQVNGDGMPGNLAHRIYHQTIQFALIAVYLFVVFGVLAIHEEVVTANIEYHFYGFAIINALILGMLGPAGPKRGFRQRGTLCRRAEGRIARI